MNYYFTVAVETCSMTEIPARWEQKTNCGHKHLSRETAEACLEKLRRRNKDGSCSALWYNARIHDQDRHRA